MAKKPNTKNETGADFTGFGTPKATVVKEFDVRTVEVDGKVYTDVVMAKDERGHYFTCDCFVGTGMLDPYRCYRRTFFGDAEAVVAEAEAKAKAEAEAEAQKRAAEAEAKAKADAVAKAEAEAAAAIEAAAAAEAEAKAKTEALEQAKEAIVEQKEETAGDQ